MPILNVKLSAEPSAVLAETVALALTEFTTTVLRKNPELTAVAVDFTPPDIGWLAGGHCAAATIELLPRH